MTFALAISIALIIYVVGVAYFLFFVGLPILFSADCDQAFLLILPMAIVLPFIWPAVLLWCAAACLIEKVRKP